MMMKRQRMGLQHLRVKRPMVRLPRSLGTLGVTYYISRALNWLNTYEVESYCWKLDYLTTHFIGEYPFMPAIEWVYIHVVVD